jgi:hypothetical protein
MMKTRATVLLSLFWAACGDGAPVPVAIDVVADPARLYYHSGQDVVLRGIVTDAMGMEVPDVEVRWTAEPESEATDPMPTEDPRATRFTLGPPGTVTFTGCFGDPETGERCDRITLLIDDGMPSLEIETPVPGAELDDPEGIVVRGSVADRSVVRVYANGLGADVDPMGNFEVTVPARFGVNHLEVDASDGLTEVSSVEMDVLWAESFTPALSADGRPELTFDDGMVLWLGQPFFDDETPADLTATPITTHDLADLIELVISSVDVNSLVPSPIVDSGGFTLSAGMVELNLAHAELDVTETGVDVFIRIGAVTANTSGGFELEGTSLPLTGSVTASLVAFARIDVSKASEADPIVVQLGDLSVGIETLDTAFVSAETQAVAALVLPSVEPMLEQAFHDAIYATVETSVPQILSDALNAVDMALADRVIPLDSAPFPPITIEIDGRMGTIESAFRRELVATMRTTMGTQSESVHPESRGVARFAAAEMQPDFFRGASMALGLRLAVLNGLLHSLWSSGLLSVDVSPLLPDGVRGLVSEAHLVGRLPPVLRPARAGETEALQLTLGQLELELTFQGQPASFGIGLDAGVTVDVANNTIAVDLSEEPVIRVWTIVPPEDERLLTPDIVANLLVGLWPDIRTSLTSALAFELPLPGLGDLGGLAPSLAPFTLELESTGPLRLRGEVLLLEGELVGTLP